MSKKKTKSEIIKKKERTSFLKKFTPKELAEKQEQFVALCVSKQKTETAMNKLKEELKSYPRQIIRITDEIEAGGITVWEECDVEIDPSTMKKQYFFEGELVSEEEADESDLQLEIEEVEGS